MKRILSIFAIAVLVVACGAVGAPTDIEGTFVDYLEQINDAVKEGDLAQAEQLIAETEMWYGSLSEKQQVEAEQALDKHIDKLNAIYESINQYGVLDDDSAHEE